MKNIIHRYLNYILISVLSLISFFSTIYYGFIGINPFDSFAAYYAAFENLNGTIPFKDYWERSGPFLDYLQSIFFKYFGVNWLSYTSHAGLINLLFVLIFYQTLYLYGLSRLYSFLYSFSLSIISNTQAGTPYYDHHAIIFSLIAVFLTFISLKNNNRWIIFFVPFILSIAFFTKQTPSSFIAIIIAVLVLYDCINSRKYLNLFIGSLGLASAITLFFLILYIIGVSFESVYIQYFKFASSVGSERVSSEGFIFPLNFSRYFIKYKLLHISYFAIIIVLIRNLINKNNYYKQKEFALKISLIIICYILIFHQMLTLNTKYIYFYIPVLLGFSHVFVKKSRYEKILINYILVICLISTSYNFYKYIDKRKFVINTENYYKDKIYKTNIIDDRYYVRWITNLDQNSKNEVKNLKNVINFFNKKSTLKNNYIIITDYQFIMTKIKNSKNIFVSKWFHPGVSHPNFDNEFYENFRYFMFQKIAKHKVEKIYFVYPSWFQEINKEYFKQFFSNCYKEEKQELEGLIDSINVQKCY